MSKVSTLVAAGVSLVLGLALTASLALAHTEALFIEHLTVQDGLSQNSVHAILQDRHGYLWLGTQDGLNRYDGYRFTVYRQNIDAATDPSGSHRHITSSMIWALYEDSAGELWVGTADGLNRFQRDVDGFVHYQHDPDNPASLSHLTVRAILESTSGEFWVGTARGGLNLMDRQTGQFTHFRHDTADPDSPPSDRISALAQTADGSLWVGTEDAGIARRDSNGQYVQFRHNPDDPASLSSDVITALLVDRNNVLWVATDGGGLNRLDPETDQITRFRHNSSDPFSISSDQLRSLHEDSAGRLWIGHYLGGGLDLMDRLSGRFTQFVPEDGVTHSLNDDHVLAIQEDNQGRLWLGTHVGGLNRNDPQRGRFRLFQRAWWNPASLNDNTIRSFLRVGPHLYVGTEGGLNVMDIETGRFTHFVTDSDDDGALPHNIVRSMARDDDGYIWLATHGGLARFDPIRGRFTTYRHDADDPHSLYSDVLWRVHVDSRGMIWAGGRDALNRLDPETGQFEHFVYDPDSPNGIGGDRIMAIHEDSRGDMWFSTVTTGVNHYDQDSGRFTNFTHQPGNPASLSNPFVFSIAEDSDGTLWFGSRGGLNRFEPGTGTFVHFTEADGLSNDVIYGILIDDDGDLWLSTNRGISRFDPRAERFMNFGVSDGLQSDEFNNGAYYRADTGEMYFGGINGFNMFEPASIEATDYLPTVVITGFTVLNEERVIGVPPLDSEPIALSHHENYLAFEFAALEFSAPERIQYQYRLEGVDPQWIDAGDRRYASYTNLRPGPYLFQVRASNSDGVWGDNTASLSIYVAPALWQVWWFQLALLAMVLLLLLAFYRYKTFTVRQRNAELESVVQERTTQLQERTAMLERINRDLESEVEQRKLAEEEVRKIAYHDYLTGLPNRRLFMSMCEQMIADAERSDKVLALMYLDVDRFKQINDARGHEVGDEVLVSVAERIRDVVRGNDLVCRMGGDEFVLVMTDVRGREGAAVAARKLIDIISLPPGQDEQKAGILQDVTIAVSVGISLFPEHGLDLDALLARADRAMYKAKRDPRSSFRFYDHHSSDDHSSA